MPSSSVGSDDEGFLEAKYKIDLDEVLDDDHDEDVEAMSSSGQEKQRKGPDVDMANNNNNKNWLMPDLNDVHISCTGCCDTRGKKSAWCAVVFLLLVTGVVLLVLSLKRLGSTEYGLEYHPRKKELDDIAKQGGLHPGPPGFRFVKFPSTFITVDLNDGKCVSRDGLRVSFDVTFQYQMPADWVHPATIKYRNFEKWSQVVKAAGNSAVQHSCSEFNISNFQNKRGIIQSNMKDNLRLKLEGQEPDGSDGVYARAISLQLSNVDLPEEYSSAVAEKQSANEDISLAKNQRTQNITKARTELNTAKEEAREIYDNAENDANITLTEATLEAEATLYQFETEKTVLLGVREKLGLTTHGLLAYLTNQLYAEAPNLAVTAQEPVKLSRKTELAELEASEEL